MESIRRYRTRIEKGGGGNRTKGQIMIGFTFFEFLIVLLFSILIDLFFLGEVSWMIDLIFIFNFIYLLLVRTMAPFGSFLFSIVAAICSISVIQSTGFKKAGVAIFANEIGKSIQHIGPAIASEEHTIVFAVKQTNLEKLDGLLHDISNPRSSSYGKYLSKDEIDDLTLDGDSIEHVENTLKRIPELKVSRLTKSGEYISVTAQVYVLNQLLQTQFQVYQAVSQSHDSKTHNGKIKRAIRALEYSLPHELMLHVDHVFHTIQHPFVVERIRPAMRRLSDAEVSKLSHTQTKESSGQRHLQLSDAATNMHPIGYIHPGILKSHYDIFSTGNEESPPQAVYSSIGVSYSIPDLNMFESVFRLPQPGPKLRSRGGHVLDVPCGENPDSCFEGQLDMEYIIGIGQNITSIYWYEVDMSTSSFTFFLIGVANDPDPPMVVSISYAMSEYWVLPMEKYFFDLEAKKVSLMGVTIIASSGDAGASNAAEESMCGYNPIFPASSIYVTTVGATQGPEV